MLRVMDGFYQGHRVFSTGHTGFKGAWMCLLAHAGAKVLGYPHDLPRSTSFFGLSRLGGHAPHFASKACVEIKAGSFAKSLFPTESFANHETVRTTARAGNVVGGGDIATDCLVPDMARAFAKDEAASVRRSGAVRPWQLVFGAIFAHLLFFWSLLGRGAGGRYVGPSSRNVRTLGE